jgi:hypothetical protein
MNVSKIVAQIFHTQVKRPVINITMNGNKIELVKEFKYQGFTWNLEIHCQKVYRKYS